MNRKWDRTRQERSGKETQNVREKDGGNDLLNPYD
jgi:hypothetical protein